MLVAGIAIAAPMLAWSASDSPPQSTQAAPGDHGTPGMGGMRGMMDFHHGWMRERMMQLPPRQRCEERLARRAGRIAYMAAKLNLTAGAAAVVGQAARR